MPTERGIAAEDLAKALAEIRELRRFTGTAKEFWQRLPAALAVLSSASRTTIMVKDPENGSWKTVADWSANGGPSRLSSVFAARLTELANSCETDDATITSLDGPAQRGSVHFAVAVKQRLLTNQICVAGFLLSEVTETAA